MQLGCPIHFSAVLTIRAQAPRAVHHGGGLFPCSIPVSKILQAHGRALVNQSQLEVSTWEGPVSRDASSRLGVHGIRHAFISSPPLKYRLAKLRLASVRRDGYHPRTDMCLVSILVDIIPVRFLLLNLFDLFLQILYVLLPLHYDQVRVDVLPRE